MPRRSAAASNGLTIGFIGTGHAEEAAVENLTLDFLDAQDITEETELSFVVPITEDIFSDSLGSVCGLAKSNEIPYVAVIEAAASSAPKSIKKYIDEASKSHKVEDAYAQVIALLKDAPRPHLFILFEEGDSEAVTETNEELSELALEAFDAGIKVFDLTDALTALQPGEEGGDGAAEAEPEPEEAPAPRRRRSAPKEEPEPEPEPAEEEDEEPGVTQETLNEFLASLVRAISNVIEDYFPDTAEEIKAASVAPEEEAEEEPPAPRRRRSSAKTEAEPAEEPPAPRRARSATKKATPAEEPAEAPRRSRGRPRKDGSPAQPRVADASTGRRLRRS